MSSIVFHAQRLHQGVYCSRADYNPEQREWRTQDAVASGAILLAVVVDALGAILRMIVETVKCLRDLEDESDDIMSRLFQKTSFTFLDLLQSRYSYTANFIFRQHIL